jgi:hypothetical protein
MLMQIKDHPVDWFAVLADLSRGGFTAPKIQACTGIPDSTIKSWKEGVEPSHSRGNRLIRLWCAAMLMSADQVPTVKAPKKRPTYRPCNSIQLSLFEGN